MLPHDSYMQRCIELAKKGNRNAMPNPSVGAVIVHENKIIGEGYTSPYGGPHAEVNAINSVKNKELLKDSTIYVSLEPCSHFGKTPPCSDLIAHHQLKTVVIGCTDTNPVVSGKGIEKLKAAGCEVISGVLEQEGRKSNKRFFTFHEKKRPYIVLKWAQTFNGYIDRIRKPEENAEAITEEFANRLVHQWRSEEASILIGTNTALMDKPSLTVRHIDGKNPLRIILDRNNKLTKDLKVFNNEAETIIHKGTIQELMDDLYSKNILSVFVEGGAQLHQSLINEGLWDEIRIFTSTKELKDGIKAPALSYEAKETIMIGNDQLKIYRND